MYKFLENGDRRYCWPHGPTYETTVLVHSMRWSRIFSFVKKFPCAARSMWRESGLQHSHAVTVAKELYPLVCFYRHSVSCMVT